MNMVKSRLLGRSTLSSTIIGVIPREPGEEVSPGPGLAYGGLMVEELSLDWQLPIFQATVPLQRLEELSLDWQLPKNSHIPLNPTLSMKKSLLSLLLSVVQIFMT